MPDNRSIAVGGFNYTNLQNTAKGLIAKFGKTGVLTVPVNEIGENPWDPASGTPVTYDVTVVQVGLDITDRSQTLIQEGDVMFLISVDGLTVEPALKHTLTVDLSKYEIVGVMPIKPGDTDMMYKAHCRQ